MILSPRALCGALAVTLLSLLPSPAGASRAGAPAVPIPPTRGAQALVKAPPVAPTDAPFSMTDPDGQGLLLEGLTVNVAVHGMLSLTELELIFRNPHPRVMEGKFKAVLPQGAVISRFAKEVDGQLVEGEVVERLRANQIYQEILHQMRDPALLEQDQGNQFQARIFPIPAGGTTRLVLSWSRLLPLEGGARTLTIPLKGLPTINTFAFHGIFQPLQAETAAVDSPFALDGVTGQAREARVVDVKEARYTPERDVRITWTPAPGAPEAESFSAGGFTLTAFRPKAKAEAAKEGPVSLWIDTSASSADGGQHLIDAARALVAALPAKQAVSVTAFDVDVAPLLKGKPAEVAAKLEAALKARRFLGATDLERALGAMAKEAQGSPGARYVLLSDGIPTLGALEHAPLTAALAGWPAGTALHAVAPGSRFDEATLATVTKGRGRVLTLPYTTSMTQRAGEVAAEIFIPVGPSAAVSGQGLEWLYPQSFDDVRPGAELIVLSRGGADPHLTARLPSGSVASPSPKALPAAFAPLLEREAYRAYLDHLASKASAETDPAVASALRTEQIKISTEHRVLCPLTTLLVLESEADYARFGLDRRALADILVVGPTGVATLDRPAAPAPAPVTRPEPQPKVAKSKEKEESIVSEVADWLFGEDDEANKKSAASEDGGAPEGPQREERRAIPLRSAEADFGGSPDSAGGDEGLARPEPVEDVVNMPGAPPPPEAMRQAPAAEPLAPPRGLADERSSVVIGGSSEDEAPAPQAAAVPSWTQQASQRPDKARLTELRAAVASSPTERGPRLALGDALLRAQAFTELEAMALDWQPYDPTNQQVYESLGEALFAQGKGDEARRAFSSLADLSPSQPVVLVRAAMQMVRAGGDARAERLLRRAMELRPDFPNTHRYLALYLEVVGRYAEAADVLEAAIKTDFPSWYGDSRRVMNEELGYVYRRWGQADAGARNTIAARAKASGVDLKRTEPLRITLSWDTDANDVDLHVVDPSGAECYYSNKRTAYMELYEDVTRGFGPEVAVSASGKKGTYHVGVNYFSSGPMGVSRGLVVVRVGQGQPGLYPFRLIEGGEGLRHLVSVDLK